MLRRPLIAASICLLVVLPRAGAAAASTTAAVTTPAAAASAPAADKFSGLLANSPFGSARAGATGGGATDPLEFRAVLEDNGNRIFSIYETASRRANWVDLNDPVNEFTVKEYDADRASVTVEYQGRPLKLTLKRAPPVMAAAPMPVPVPGNVTIVAGNRPGQTPVVQVQAAPQQIQQIRDEINRRRALRQQPVTPGNTPAAQTQPPARP